MFSHEHLIIMLYFTINPSFDNDVNNCTNLLFTMFTNKLFVIKSIPNEIFTTYTPPLWGGLVENNSGKVRFNLVRVRF